MSRGCTVYTARDRCSEKPRFGSSYPTDTITWCYQLWFFRDAPSMVTVVTCITLQKYKRIVSENSHTKLVRFMQFQIKEIKYTDNRDGIFCQHMKNLEKILDLLSILTVFTYNKNRFEEDINIISVFKNRVHRKVMTIRKQQDKQKGLQWHF